MNHSCNGPFERQMIPPRTIKNPRTQQEEALWENPCPIPFEFQALPKQIGEGTMGSIFEATCGDDSSFAIKWIRPSYSTPLEEETNSNKEIALQNRVAPRYAKPIYEKWICKIGGLISKNGAHITYGYVTDRLDVTLRSDLYTLSDEQITLAKQHYLSVFDIIFNDLSKIIRNYKINHGKETFTFPIEIESEEFRGRLEHMTSSPYSLSNCIDFLYSIKNWLEQSKILISVDSVDPIKIITVPVFFIQDTIQQKRKKCFQLLLVMNTLDGIYNAGIVHRDANETNFMRKKGEDKYYAIDFAYSAPFEWNDDEAKYNHDISDIRRYIEERMEGRSHLPVQHDVHYLVDIISHLKEIVSCEYDTSPEIYKEFVDKFNRIFYREIVQPEIKKELLERYRTWKKNEEGTKNRSNIRSKRSTKRSIKKK